MTPTTSNPDFATADGADLECAFVTEALTPPVIGSVLRDAPRSLAELDDKQEFLVYGEDPVEPLCKADLTQETMAKIEARVPPERWVRVIVNTRGRFDGTRVALSFTFDLARQHVSVSTPERVARRPTPHLHYRHPGIVGRGPVKLVKAMRARRIRLRDMFEPLPEVGFSRTTKWQVLRDATS